MCILDCIYCKELSFQQWLLEYFGCTCNFGAIALGMALNSAFLFSLLVFSLTLPFLIPHCETQSDYLLSSGPGSTEATARVREFLVAPRKHDCNRKILPCDTVSFYTQNYTTGLSDAIFYFLPGNHTLFQDWEMSNFSNITLRGQANFGQHHSIRRDEVEIYGSIQVSHSELVVVENVMFKYSSSMCLLFHSTMGVVVWILLPLAIAHIMALKYPTVKIWPSHSQWSHTARWGPNASHHSVPQQWNLLSFTTFQHD